MFWSHTLELTLFTWICSVEMKLPYMLDRLLYPGFLLHSSACPEELETKYQKLIWDSAYFASVNAAALRHWRPGQHSGSAVQPCWTEYSACLLPAQEQAEKTVENRRIVRKTHWIKANSAHVKKFDAARHRLFCSMHHLPSELTHR